MTAEDLPRPPFWITTEVLIHYSRYLHNIKYFDFLQDQPFYIQDVILP